jgi:spermidine synthase
MSRALLLSALTGAVALSYEILWARLYSFASGAVSNSFGIMLGSYLLGLGLGSLAAGRICEKAQTQTLNLRNGLAVFILAANLAGFLLSPAVSWLVIFVHPYWTLPLLTISAALLGAAFPLISHLAVPPDSRAGMRLGLLYLANIAGSSAGSLLTGFILLDYLSFSTISILLLGCGLLLSLMVLAKRSAFKIGALALCLAMLFGAREQIFDGMYERLQMKHEMLSKGLNFRFARIYESKSGVIAIGQDGSIHGGGMYDGYLEYNLRAGSWLLRPFSLSLFHPAPRRILVVGVSGGAWTAILAAHPQAESVKAVEINKQYRQVIEDHPGMRHILANPRLELIFDDGRRWLMRNPDVRFDAVVMNTTYHYRSYVSGLLSREYMTLVRRHLDQKGIFLFNTTDSKDAMRTALEVFDGKCMMVLNAAACSPSPLELNTARWLSTLDAYAINGARVLDQSEESRKTRAFLAALPGQIDRVNPVYQREAFRSAERMKAETSDARIVTDDNMATEMNPLQ